MEKIPVTSEFYDELIFENPNKKMFQLLSKPQLSTPCASHNIDYAKRREEDLKKIIGAKKIVRNEIAKLITRLAEVKVEVAQMKPHVN